MKPVQLHKIAYVGYQLVLDHHTQWNTRQTFSFQMFFHFNVVLPRNTID